jgi:hypothetical protein
MIVVSCVMMTAGWWRLELDSKPADYALQVLALWLHWGPMMLMLFGRLSSLREWE